MSIMDKIRSFSESRESDGCLVRDGITYGDCREAHAIMAKRSRYTITQQVFDSASDLAEKLNAAGQPEAAKHILDTARFAMSGKKP